jgi:starch synthase (maltosyl-transferring)
MARAFPSAVIENLRPLIDGGRYPVKRIAGDDLAVEADVFKDGHDVVAAALKWRRVGEPRWHETPMNLVDNDRWRGVCSLNEVGTYEYTVEAWTDTFRSWREEFGKKFEAGVSNLSAEALEGAEMIEAAGKRAPVAEDSTRLCELSECIRTADNAQINEMVHSGELEVLMAIVDRHFVNVCRGSMTRRRWDSTSFIFRRSIRSVTRIAKAETIP